MVLYVQDYSKNQEKGNGNMKMSNKKILGTFVAVLLLLGITISSIDAASYSKSVNLSTGSMNGASAKVTANATYRTDGNTRWTAYSSSGYSVSNTATYGITSTRMDWTLSGSDGVGYHQRKFNWNCKSYKLSDRGQKAVSTKSKVATFTYNISSGSYTAVGN